MAHAIELTGVGKRYTKYVDTPMIITSALRFRPQTRREKLWAVRGVDLTLEDGEVVGVIGRNGSGKTTLMSMVAGITAPTEGTVKVWGRVAPLISVGVGFHRELTGRENVYVNGTILGLTRKQIEQKFDEIVAFSEVEAFIDTPVKFYSSGMFVRLGFAVAAHCDPDVLIVDEVLAVGDLAFQIKCFERMTQIRERGTTVLMVSHALPVIRRMSQRVLLMHQGEPQFLGDPEKAIGLFHELLHSQEEIEVDSSGLRFEPKVIEIKSIEFVGPDGTARSHFDAGELATVRVEVNCIEDVDDLVVAILLHGPDGSILYTDSTVGHRFGSVRAGDVFTWTASFPLKLSTGSYSLGVRIDRADLRTTLAHGVPLNFFVTGRPTVLGEADLEASFSREDATGATKVSDAQTPWQPVSGSPAPGNGQEPRLG
jgi:ABC-type polysaccharide/polyol phosphate transport system ATPase subunit